MRMNLHECEWSSVWCVFCRALRGAMLAVLNHINPGDVTQGETRWVQFVIDNMNNLQIYVDELARTSGLAIKLLNRPSLNG